MWEKYGGYLKGIGIPLKTAFKLYTILYIYGLIFS